MYDTFAHEYGYTLDEFLSLTARQVQALSLSIERRKVMDRYPMQAFLASLKNAKIKSLDEILSIYDERENPVFDKQTDTVLERRAFERLKEMREKKEF